MIHSMDMDELAFPLGTAVVAAPHEHAFGACFLSGPGRVIENRDPRSRLARDVLVLFENGHTGRFTEKDAETLLAKV